MVDVHERGSERGRKRERQREREREQQHKFTQKQACTQVREHAHLPGTSPQSGCRAVLESACLGLHLMRAPAPPGASASIAQLVRARA